MRSGMTSRRMRPGAGTATDAVTVNRVRFRAEMYHPANTAALRVLRDAASPARQLRFEPRFGY